MLKQICNRLIPQSTLQNGVCHENLDTLAAARLIFNCLFEQKIADSTLSSALDKENEIKCIKNLLEVRTNQSTKIPITNDDVWIFGYGSLVWKADFPFIDRRCGYITGYQRYFFQLSIDHRGIPNKPGRVVTLVPTNKSEDRVYGMAYRIAASQKQEVLQHLDYREKNGYERCSLKFFEFPETTGVSFDVIMYVATEDNESYAGHIWQIPKIADQIFTSAGPSGPNREYLFHLAKAMRILFPGVDDKHLFELEAEVLKRIENEEPKILAQVLTEEIERILKVAACDNKELNELEYNKQIEEIVSKIKNLESNCKKPGWKEFILAKEYLVNQKG